jgi:hypothetical protein
MEKIIVELEVRQPHNEEEVKNCRSYLSLVLRKHSGLFPRVDKARSEEVQ